MRLLCTSQWGKAASRRAGCIMPPRMHPCVLLTASGLISQSWRTTKVNSGQTNLYSHFSPFLDARRPSIGHTSLHLSRRDFREKAATSTDTTRVVTGGNNAGTTAQAKETSENDEEEELRKDRAALRRGVWGAGFAVLCVLTVWYGLRRARKRYIGEQGSARVSVETRGRPALGGPFVLVNTRGEPVSQAEFLGSWAFFYFGFTHCPEICPVELNRMSHVVDAVRAARPQDKIVPLFVSCDPRRDSLEAIAEYLSVFHEDFVGLVGTPKQVDRACKSYRIYYSIPTDEEADETSDYLIDHSIAIFLFDPQGRFVDFFGNRYDEKEITAKVLHYMKEYERDPSWTNW